MFGKKGSSSFKMMVIALGIFFFVLVGEFLYNYFLYRGTNIANPLLLIGISTSLVLAIIQGYRDGGLAISWTIVLAPLIGALMFGYWELLQSSTQPAPMIGTFFDGWDFWIPVGLVIGTLCYFLGYIIQLFTKENG
jgi:hypothetical protein